MKIEVCFGSSCHVKGSPQIFQMLQDEIKKNHLEDKVSLGGTLCISLVCIMKLPVFNISRIQQLADKP